MRNSGLPCLRPLHLPTTHGVEEVRIVLCTTELIDEKFGRLQFVHGVARGLVTGGAGRLREARDLSHPSVSRDAWSQRSRRCSLYHGAYRREIRSLPVRPWDKAVCAAPISFAGFPSRSAIPLGACRSG